MAGTLKVDSINADSNLALKIANTAVAFIDATGLRPVAGNLNLDATATSKFYLPSANTVAIQTAGVTGLSISSSQVMTLANALPVTSGGTGVTTSTGTGAVVLGTSPTITTPTISSLSSASATALTLQSAGTTAITVDTSQNVGIGTASPVSKLEISDASANSLRISGAGDHALGFTGYSGNAATQVFSIRNDGINNCYINTQNSVPLNFGVSTGTTFGSTTSHMRIDSSGNLLVGTTGISTGTFKGIQCGVNSGGAGNYLTQNPAGTSTRQWNFGMNNSDQYVVYGFNNTTFNTGAYIAWGGTSWTASSDERKKDIIEPIENGLQKVSTLRAVIGKYKTDEEGTRRSFLIAQDLQAVLPEAVDASNPDDLGVQYTEVIPLLVSAIKELKAINDTQAETINALTANLTALTARITALESTP